MRRLRRKVGLLSLAAPYWHRPVLAEDFSTLKLRRDFTRTRKPGVNRPMTVIH